MSPTGLRALTQSHAKEILDLYNSGQYTQRELAARFGVSQGTISNIVSCRFYVMERKNPLKSDKP